MTELLWQTIFLLAGAFFFGAVLACGLKRRFYYGAPVRAAASAGDVPVPTSAAPNASQPKIEVGAQPAPEGARFERALSGQSSASATVSPAAPSQLVVPPTAVRVEPAKEPAPQPAPVRPAAPEPAPEPAPAPTAKPASPQPAMEGIPRVSVSKGSGAPMKTEEGGVGPSEDLTRIDGIDSSMERRLREFGIRRLQELAGLTPADVKGLSESLHLGGRIERENWVAQAQILVGGGETYYSRRVDHGVPVPDGADPAAAVATDKTPVAAPAPARPAPAPVAAPVSAPAPAPQATATPAPPPGPMAAAVAPRPAQEMGHLRSVRSEALLGEDGARTTRPSGDADDLKRIRGIGVLIEKKLNSLGIGHYEQIANWTGADIERISRLLDFKGRIERENWIEQARILATGGQTEFSRRGG